MNNRWGIRIAGILLILVLFFVLNQMKKTLEQMQEMQQQSAPAR